MTCAQPDTDLPPATGPKYEFTGDVKTHLGIKLRRIRAASTFGSITAGTVGGWIEREENLSQVSGNAWVSGGARVYGNAQVHGNAWVSGGARVYGDAQVYGNAWVYGEAQVYGNAQVSGNTQVYGEARVSGDAQVSGDAWVSGEAQVYGDAWVYGDAQVYGNAQVHGEAQVSGNAQVYGNARVYGDARVYGNAQVHGNAQVYGNAWVSRAITLASRSDGYVFLLATDAKTRKPVVIAGCRYFTFDQARRHWTRTRAGTPLGDETFATLDMLERIAAVRGPEPAPPEGEDADDPATGRASAGDRLMKG